MYDEHGINKQEFVDHLEDFAAKIGDLADCAHGDVLSLNQIMAPDLEAELQIVESILRGATERLYRLIEKY